MIKIFCYNKSTFIQSIIPVINYQEDMIITEQSFRDGHDSNLLLLDIDSFGVEEILERIVYFHKTFPGVSIIIVTNDYLNSIYFTLFEAGVDQVLSKSSETLIDSISYTTKQNNNSGMLKQKAEFHVEVEKLKMNAIKRFSIKLEQAGIHLSDREAEVAFFIRFDLKNRQIAEKLNLGKGTINVHISNIYSRIGNKNRKNAIDLFRGIFPLAESSKSYAGKNWVNARISQALK
ncbi:helix-turn-helix transcriptional regulator [Virgibacillus sp. DJP39]|uniref:helix-turn-helix transcriptional regulator n=1 Tax=Virgibacillus sp. DJP39 TaxID=3409790 RepID=UPI003BB748C3